MRKRMKIAMWSGIVESSMTKRNVKSHTNLSGIVSDSHSWGVFNAASWKSTASPSTLAVPRLMVNLFILSEQSKLYNGILFHE